MLAEILKEASANRDFLKFSGGCLVVAFLQQKLGQCSLTLLARCTCSLILLAMPSLTKASWILFPPVPSPTLSRLSRVARLNDGILSGCVAIRPAVRSAV
ncbi:hypothetical protein C5615_33895 [Burkholderia cepacia]|uniref:Uncharacterized protein n=1 Tax=Burkholderia cepacia TaxID=292 RepID=A0A2S8I5S1_BURCE|nr:hypothetical protein C5615_33895 [Burkholderia cepacia]